MAALPPPPPLHGSAAAGKALFHVSISTSEVRADVVDGSSFVEQETGAGHLAETELSADCPSLGLAHPFEFFDLLKQRKPRLCAAIEGVLERCLPRSGRKNYVPPAMLRRLAAQYDLMTAGQLKGVCREAAKLFLAEESLVEMRAPVKVFGDLHGQMSDLLHFFDCYGCPSHLFGDINHCSYLFIGDFVDRGAHSLETATLLFCLKLRYHPHVVILRGNHEDAAINKSYGFMRECVGSAAPSRHPPAEDFPGRLETVGFAPKVCGYFEDAFDALPFGALVEGRILAVHGGIGQSVRTLDQIRAIQRPVQPLGGHIDDAVVVDLLWSDPTETKNLAEHAAAAVNLKRGKHMTFFGPTDVERFCIDNDVDLIVRAHQVRAASLAPRRRARACDHARAALTSRPPTYARSHSLLPPAAAPSVPRASPPRAPLPPLASALCSASRTVTRCGTRNTA